MKYTINLKDYYSNDTTPLINLINDANKHSVSPNEFGAAYLYLMNHKEIWVLTASPHYTQTMAVGMLNPLTLKMEIEIMSSATLNTIRYDGTVDRVLFNRHPTKLIKIINKHAKAIEEARKLIGL